MHDIIPAWLEIAAGGLGLGFALWSIARRRQGKPMHPDPGKADVWLAVFSVAMIAIGAARWPG